MNVDESNLVLFIMLFFYFQYSVEQNANLIDWPSQQYYHKKHKPNPMKNRINAVIHESAYQSQESLSLNDDSVIEQYAGLNFSDEQSNSNDQFSSEDAGHKQLSQQKLKFLGVHKFPSDYAHQANTHSNSKIVQADTKEQSHFINNTRKINRARSRKANSYRSSNSSQNCEMSWSDDSIEKKPDQTKSQFNIDSFLNSQPIAYHSRDHDKKQIMGLRRQANRNQLGKYGGEQSKRQRIKWPPRQSNKNNTNQSQFVMEADESSSTILVTLPEPDQRVISCVNKANSMLKKVQKQSEKSNQMFKMRFEQAKLNFMDSFLPQTMKIGNNPYKFWKYANSKQNHLNFKIL